MPVYFPTTTTTTTTSLANVGNFNPTVNLPHWRAAKARVNSGGGNARILFIGDSTTLGVGASGSLTTGEMPGKSFPNQVAAAFNVAGLNAHANSWFGGGAHGAGAPCRSTNDGTWTFGSDWTYTGADILGGSYVQSTAATTHPFVWTPANSVNTFELYVPWQSGVSFGKISYNIDGGSNTTFDENSGTGTFSVKKIIATAGSAGTHALNMLNNTGTAYVAGCSAYNSVKSWVDCMNAGYSGSTVSSWVQNGMFGATAFPLNVLAPDLIIINLGINDWAQGTALATYVTNMQTVITKCLAASADVILMTPNPSGITTAGGETGIPIATQYPYVQALYGLAYSNNLPLLDLWNRWGTYESQSAVPTPLVFNNYHPVAAGYTDIGNFVSKVLLAA